MIAPPFGASHLRSEFRSSRLILAILPSLVATSAAAQDSLPRKLPPVVTVTRDVGRSPLDLPYAITSLRPDSHSPGQTHTFVEQTLSLLARRHRRQPNESVAGHAHLGARLRRAIAVRRAQHSHPARRHAAHAARRTDADRLSRSRVGRTRRGDSRQRRRRSMATHRAACIDLRSIDRADGAVRRPAALVGRRIWSPALRRDCSAARSAPAAYIGNIGRTQSDGYRAYCASAARPTRSSAARPTVGKTQLALTGLGLDMPIAENPGALTRAQADSAPEQADPPSVHEEGAQGRASGPARTVGAATGVWRRRARRAGTTAELARSSIRSPSRWSVWTDSRAAPARASRCRGRSADVDESCQRRRRRAVAERRAKELGELQRGRRRPTPTCPSIDGREGRTVARSERARVERRSVRARRDRMSAGSARRPVFAPTRCASSCAITISTDGRDDSGIRDAARGESDARRRGALVAVSLALRQRRLGVRDADDDGARQSGRWQRRTQSRSQAAVLDDVRDGREGTRAEPRAVRRRAVRHRSARRADSVRGPERQRAHVLSERRPHAPSRRRAASWGPTSARCRSRRRTRSRTSASGIS